MNIFNIIIIIILVYILSRLPSIETMANIDTATENKIREIYKVDIDAIRNLSNLAKDLTVNGKLRVPGGLEIDGNLLIKGDTSLENKLQVKGGTTLNTLNSTGDVILDKSVTVKGGTTLNTLNSTGDVILDKSVTVKGGTTLNTLNSTGDVILDKSVTVKGTSIMNSLNTKGETILDTSLLVKGNTVLNIVHTKGNSLIDGNLEVKGNTINNNIQIKGATTIDNNLLVKGNSEVLKQTTIHELYGGKSTWGGWRNIIVNGGHLMFDVGNKGFGMHSNENGLHYKVNNTWQPLNIYGGIHSIGNVSITENLSVNKDINLGSDLKMEGGKTIRSTGRLHIHPQERLYLLAKGTFITSDWNSEGNLIVSNDIASTNLNLLPKGTIILWTGINVPSGWILCDGKNGSPNLIDRFVKGGNLKNGTIPSVDQTGGSKNKSLVIANLPEHNHGSSCSIEDSGNHNHTGTTNNTGGHTHTGSGTTSNAGNHNHDLGRYPVAGWPHNDHIRNSCTIMGSNSQCNLGEIRHSNWTGNHSHSFSFTTASSGAHDHTFATTSNGLHKHNCTSSTTNTGSGSEFNIEPPFYVLAYIMKI
jgi:cytoskeletal protein CcmA (bactofilin family)